MENTILTPWLPRIFGDGLFYPSIMRLDNAIGSWEEWFTGWANLAREFEATAEQSSTADAVMTAAEYRWQASLAWHYACFLWFRNDDERQLGRRRRVENFRLAAPHFTVPAEFVSIDFEDTFIPGYLRIPSTSMPAPCVIIIGGLDSVKEDNRYLSDILLDRGVATFSFDGPGQGEYFDQRYLQPDYERYISAVMDYLQTRSDIRTEAFGAVGRSLGGYYVVRGAITDPRLRAFVAWGGTFDLSDFDRIDDHTQEAFLYVTGEEDAEKAKRTVTSFVDLAPLAEELAAFDGRALIYHGAGDSIFPVAQVERLASSMSEAHRVLDIDPDEGHCCHRNYPRTRRHMADWIVRELAVFL